MLALARHLPRLAARIAWQPLGAWPTPIDAMAVPGGVLWIKREGASSPRYGGNKVRTLEPWFGHARERGARRLWSIGAYGSNHAVAAALHAPPDLEVGAIVFPQPSSAWAVENCSALIGALGERIVALRSVVEVPFAAHRIARRDRDAIVMPPGGATPLGTLGAASAVFELAEQIADGAAPPPRRIVLPAGSTCTAAGLLAGLALAHVAGAWRWPLPIVHAVRVTPWPITSPLVVAELAHRTLVRVARLGGPRVVAPRGELLDRLVVDAGELGPGYGRPTRRALDAIASWTSARLDGVYSGKAAVALLRLHRAGVAPLLFWATKSEVELPPAPLAQLRAGPRRLLRWLKAG